MAFGTAAWVVGRIRGIPIRLHASLALILPLLAVFFANQMSEVDGLFPPAAWGILVAVALFASVLVHELAHSLVAARLGGRVRGITLMFLGGVSELEGVLAPRREVVVTAVGPLASLAIGGAVLGVRALLGGAAPDVRAAVQLVGLLNIVLGVFNLVPAFPLDGGRLVRALLALRLGRLRATRIAGVVGKIIAVAIAFVGVRYGDLMLLLVCAFVYVGAQRETEGVELDEATSGLRVLDATSWRRLTLPLYVTVAEAAALLLTARADTGVVVGADGAPLGAVTVAELHRAAPRAPILAVPGAQAGVVERDEPLRAALARLGATGADALPVVGPGGALVGVLRRDGIERLLALRDLTGSGQTAVSHSG